MSHSIKALYEIHRHQILLDVLRRDVNEQVLPPGYIFALDRRLPPIFHTDWCDGADPYESIYRPNSIQVREVYLYVNRIFRLGPKYYLTFNQIEKRLGNVRTRYLLRLVLRYCYQSEKFNEAFYKKILTKGEHPEEAASIIKPYGPSEIVLV